MSRLNQDIQNIKSKIKESKDEIVILLDWTWPIVISNVLNNVVYLLVNMVFAGHLGSDELAAVSLGNTWQFATSAFAMGALNAMDTIISQSFGAKNYQLIGQTVQSATVLSCLFCFIISIIWLFTEPMLILIHQDVVVSKLAQEYCIGLIPGLWFGTFLNILQKYLQGQGIMKPSIVIGVFLNIANAIFNFILVHGISENQGLGVIGCALATSFSKILGLGFLIGWIYYFKLHEYPVKTWFGFTRASIKISNLKEFMKLGVPAGLQLLFEMCGFEILTIFSGLFGPTSLDAHSIAMNFTLLTFMAPLSLSIALSVRIGQLLGDRQPMLAKRSTRIGFCISACFIVVIASVQFFSRHYIGSLYSNDKEVQSLVARILPISTFFQIFDHFQTTCQGIVRGVGRNTIGAALNFISFYAVGVPLAALFAFVFTHNVIGLWWGLCCGLAMCAFTLGIVVIRIDWNKEMEKAIERTSGGNGELIKENNNNNNSIDIDEEEEEEEEDNIILNHQEQDKSKLIQIEMDKIKLKQIEIMIEEKEKLENNNHFDIGQGDSNNVNTAQNSIYKNNNQNNQNNNHSIILNDGSSGSIDQDNDNEKLLQ